MFYKGFDDMSLPVKFNIDENDQALTIILDNFLEEWALDIDDFYNYHFEVMDVLIISGSEKTYEIHGPLITDSITEDGN